MAGLKFISPNSNIIATNGGNTLYEVYAAQQGQTVFYLNGNFQVGAHELNVYENGVLQEVESDYIEINNQTIQFTNPMSLGTSILFTIDGVYTERLNEVQIATPNQTVFLLTTGLYHPNYRTLLVFNNGMLQSNTVDYEETNSTTITFLRPMNGDESITFYEQV